MTVAEGPVTVDVPASSANLGAGFDTLALALDLADIFTVEAAHDLPPGAIAVVVEGEGAATLPSDGSDRFSRALRRGLDEIEGSGAAGRAWRVRMHNAIPVGRGLGSSAAATVGGLAAADLLLGGARLSAGRLLAIATEFEGHPDNVAAALHGGFVVAVASEGAPSVVRFDPPNALLAVLFVPARPLPTRRMREVLPESVPRRDAVYNVGRASLSVAAFATGRLELLIAATSDRLHETYRAVVFPELPDLIVAARTAGALGACLSGAGSSVIAFADGHHLAERVAAALEREAGAADLAGRAMIVRPRSEGVIGVGRPTDR